MTVQKNVNLPSDKLQSLRRDVANRLDILTLPLTSSRTRLPPRIQAQAIQSSFLSTTAHRLLPTDLLTIVELNSLEHRSVVPLYHQVYELIRAKIRTSSQLLGRYLPGVQQLAEAFNVSRVTISRACPKLRSDGLIELTRPKGMRVLYDGREPSATTVFVEVSSHLEVAVEGLVLRGLPMKREISAIASGDNASLGSVRDSVFSAYVCSDLGGWDIGYCERLASRTIPARLRDGDNPFEAPDCQTSRIEHSLNATKASHAAVQNLDLIAGDPVIRLHRTVFDDSGGVLESLICEFHSERFNYQFCQPSKSGD